MSQAPKSSFEIAMERLRAADEKSGAEERPLTDAQKERIAEARRVAAARVAEREILFHDALRRTFDEAAREKLEKEYRIDRERIESDREQAVETIRRGG